MIDVTDSKIESEISYHKEGIEQAVERIAEESVPDDRYPIVYYSMGMDAEKIGIWHLVKGDIATARQWFDSATSYYIERIRKGQKFREELEKSYWENEPMVFREALYCAILSGSNTLQNEVADEALSMDDAYQTEFPTVVYDFYFVRALGAILLERDGVREYVEKMLSNVDHLRPELYTYFSALGAIAEGLVTDDADRTATGLGKLLDYHDNDIQGSPKGADEIVCVPATALLILARERGLDIEIESGYIPDSLLA